MYAAWAPGDGTPHREWVDAVEASLALYALPDAYPNYFGPDRPAWAAHGDGPNAARLLWVKAAYDPGGIFSAITLPAATGRAA